MPTTSRSTLLAAAKSSEILDWLTFGALAGAVAALQFSIAVAQILFAVTTAGWLALLATTRTRPSAPRFFWLLLVYAGVTLAAVVWSPNPLDSLTGPGKQLVLLFIVPAVYQLARGRRAVALVHVIVSAGAASAAVGIVQYGILHYDDLNLRPHGTLGMYMTYSGLLMLVICIALARVLFGTRHRTWPALVMPALLVAVAISFGRNAWVGAVIAATLLLSLKDVRLLIVLPIVAGIFLMLAPARLTHRFYSIFDLSDPTNHDRVAMWHAGQRMVTAHPVFGVGPNMVWQVYPEYQDPDAIQRNVHLHNVPLQIAAERGLPALLVWVWFLVRLTLDVWQRFRTSRDRFVAAGGLAAIAAMLGAGFFEYNFGDSEFLMLFLVLITLPFAVDRDPATRPAPAEGPTART